MLIKLDPAEFALVKARLESDEDCEKTSQSEYVWDLYDFDPPVTMELELLSNGVDVLACEKLEFSEEMDGWYVSGRVEDEGLIKRAIIGGS